MPALILFPTSTPGAFEARLLTDDPINALGFVDAVGKVEREFGRASCAVLGVEPEIADNLSSVSAAEVERARKSIANFGRVYASGCPNCGGTGEIAYRFDRSGSPLSFERCARCGGQG